MDGNQGMDRREVREDCRAAVVSEDKQGTIPGGAAEKALGEMSRRN